MACYDLLGKKAGMPVYKLLGGQNNYIETDMTVGIDEPEIMAAKAKKHVEAGFDTIKTKVGTSFDEDIARVKAIREAVGDDIKIRVDANQAWTAKEAVRLIELSERVTIWSWWSSRWLTTILPVWNIVTKHSPIVPIMSDESVLQFQGCPSCWSERRAIDLT